MTEQAPPRLAPIPIGDWNDEILDALGAFPNGLKFVLTQYQSDSGDLRGSNVLGAFAHYPKMAQAFLTFNNHVAANSSLEFREREILILRTGWLRKCQYEFVQHIILGKRAGLTDDDIARIQEGPDAKGWLAADQLLVQAADELHKQTTLSDETYQRLREHYSHQQIMDIIGCLGCYIVIAMLANSFHMPMEEGSEPLDAQTLAKMMSQN